MTLPCKNLHVTETESIDNVNSPSWGGCHGDQYDALGSKPEGSQKADVAHSSPRQRTTIRYLKVRTVAETTRAAQVAKEMRENRIEVLGIIKVGRRGWDR